MKAILIAILIFGLSITSAQAGHTPAGHAGDWVCQYPYFSTAKWCHGKAGK